MEPLSHAFSNEQEEVEQEGLSISSWLKQGESDENMTEGDKSKNTRKPGGVKGVKVEKYEVAPDRPRIPSNWTCDLAMGKCIVKGNPANEKDVFKRVEDCIKNTECSGFIKKDAKGTPAKATRGRVTRAKATRTTQEKGTPVKMYLSSEPEPEISKMNKRKSKKRKRRRNKSKKKKKQTKKKSKK